ncbi:hypothetical protein BDV06DRAFT_143178 [Aspergillus oleicola]
MWTVLTILPGQTGVSVAAPLPIYGVLEWNDGEYVSVLGELRVELGFGCDRVALCTVLQVPQWQCGVLFWLRGVYPLTYFLADSGKYNCKYNCIMITVCILLLALKSLLNKV